MSPFIFRPILILGGALSLPLVARAQPMSESADFKAPEVASKPLSQAEFADAATSQIGFLASIRSWRDTLRGGGAQAKRQFTPLSVGGQKLGFSLGQVAPPILGSGAGMVATWSALEVGTTAQPQALTEVLGRFDGLLSGEAVKPTDATQMTWLRARPIQTKTAQVELSIADGRRDMLAGDGQKWLGGTFETAKAHLSLPAKWSLNSDFTRGQLDTQSDAASSWGLNASGPIAHPWGVARASANFRNVDDGYASLANPTSAVGQKTGALEIAQDVAHGPLSGSLKVAATTRQRAELQSAKVGEEVAADGTQSEAQMRLKVMPNLVVTTSGRVQLADTRRAGATPASASASASTPSNAADGVGPFDWLSPAQARELSQQMAGDVGLEWRFSKALSLAVSTGASRARLQTEAGEVWNDGPSSDENRRAVEVRHKRGASDLRLRLAQRDRTASGLASGTASGTTNLNAAAISQWRVEAARPIFGVGFKTIVDMARDTQSDQTARRIEAQLQLARAARFDARYREGNLTQNLLGDDWSSAFGAPNPAMTKQWAARFNAGSAASGNGLGLALEYARGIGSTSNDSWRVGVQFK